MSVAVSRSVAWLAALSRRPAMPRSAAIVGLAALACGLALEAGLPRARSPLPPAAPRPAARVSPPQPEPSPGDLSRWSRRAVAPVAEVPASILLKVAQASTLDRGGICTVVEGVAEPGAAVRVDGALVKAEPGTRYRVQVARKPGVRAAKVMISGSGGVVEERDVPCAAEGEEIEDLAVEWNASSPDR